MIFDSEAALLSFAENLGKSLSLPAVFELIGDVGAGKTTFTRGLAKGLGIKAPITSPTFTISNRYDFTIKRARTSAPSISRTRESASSTSLTDRDPEKFIGCETTDLPNRDAAPVVCELVHYDFYRLDDPGLMSLELEETLSNKNSVVVVEWGESVAELLPENRYIISFEILPDGSREITVKEPSK